MQVCPNSLLIAPHAWLLMIYNNYAQVSHLPEKARGCGPYTSASKNREYSQGMLSAVEEFTTRRGNSTGGRGVHSRMSSDSGEVTTK